MTTATAIQARIAYALRDGHSADDAIVEFLSHEIDGPRQTYGLSERVGSCYDAENVGIQSSEGAVVAASLILDDFGGRSDAGWLMPGSQRAVARGTVRFAPSARLIFTSYIRRGVSA